MKRYFERHETLGIHYLIGRNGAIADSIPENQVANHALGHNRSSIGIELINRGDGQEAYPSAQVESLIRLLKALLERHEISIGGIQRHSEIDDRTFTCLRPGRVRQPVPRPLKLKQDPGPALPWARVIEQVGKHPEYRLWFYNVDDRLTAFLNGRQVLRCELFRECDTTLNRHLVPGENRLRIELYNAGGPYHYGWQLGRAGQRWKGDECGSRGRTCTRLGGPFRVGTGSFRRKLEEITINW